MASRDHLISARSRVWLRPADDARLVGRVRKGDTEAFEAIYDRHASELLAFCMYMLRSRQDAEDALQASFASAYRALLADVRPIRLRPWLFTIARNQCITSLRSRHPTVELNGEPALTGDPVRHAETREEIRDMLAGLRELPEKQRTALVLAEVHGLSQAEIGAVLQARAEQVKAYVYQARSNLLAERVARQTDCAEIREELATAHGPALLRTRLRRHLRSCDSCRAFADGVKRQNGHLGVLVPVIPALALKYRALEQAFAIGSSDPSTVAGSAVVGASAAGAAAELASGGVKTLAVKVAAGVAAVSASAGVGISVMHPPTPARDGQASTAAAAVSPSSSGTGATSGGTGGLSSGATGVRGAVPAGAPGSPGAQPHATATPTTGGVELAEGSPAGPGAAQEPGASGDGQPTQTGAAAEPPGAGATQGKHAPDSQQERERERAEIQRKRAERAQQRALRKQEEQHQQVGVARAPRSKEERLRQHEERQRQRLLREGEHERRRRAHEDKP